MGNSPKDILISYDITNKHDVVIDAMQKLGYQNFLYKSNTKFELPESTLFHNQKYSQTAYDDFLKVITDINKDLEPSEKIKVKKIVSAKADDLVLYSVTE